MGVILRGVKNAFRNMIRAGSIAVILGLSIGLALVMLIALTTIQTKIDSVKSSIGNTIAITPAGARGFDGGGEPLTTDTISAITSIAHVIKVDQTLQDRLSSTTTSLQSAINAGSLGQRNGRFNRSQDSSGTPKTVGGANGQTIPTTFTPPITVTGSTNAASMVQSSSGSSLNFTSGALFAATSTDNVAVLGKALAAKNNLPVGSTFKAYNTDIKVVGIFDAGNTFANSGLAMPIKTLQTLSGQVGQLSSATITVDSISNLTSTASAISSTLASKADVVSAQDSSDQAITPLENIKTISFYSLVGSLATGAVIIFLTMLMIVRERRREIGVLKALGASNVRVIGQFVSEAFTFTVMGGILGLLLGVVLSNPVLTAMARSATTSTARVVGQGVAGQGGGFAQGFRRLGPIGQAVNPTQILHSLQAQFGWQVLLYGLMAVIAIAIIGSAVPAYLTARVRPAEVLRSE
jgi:putative ABC transport system permease protein